MIIYGEEGKKIIISDEFFVFRALDRVKRLPHKNERKRDDSPVVDIEQVYRAYK